MLHIHHTSTSKISSYCRNHDVLELDHYYKPAILPAAVSTVRAADIERCPDIDALT